MLESGAATLLAEYRPEGRLLAVAGINAGAAVMARRAEIAAAYQQHSLADIGGSLADMAESLADIGLG